MSKKFTSLLFIFILCVGILFGQVATVGAQAVVATPTPVPTAAYPGSDPNIVTLSMLGRSEIHLTGPYDSYYFSFGLPADWKITSGATLNLKKMVSISTGVDTTQTGNNVATNLNGVMGGTLTVMFNSSTLAVIPLVQGGDLPEIIQIPPEAFTTTNTSGLMDVAFILNSGFSCRLLGQTNVVLRADSAFSLPHDLVLPATDLAKFPRPIYQNSFAKDSALLVVPDKPSAAELQSALTVSSGLGVLTAGALTLDLTTVGQLTADQKAANHIIYVGNAASLSKLGNLPLALPVGQEGFSLKEDKPDEVGVVQMIDSPWSKSRVLMVVSGNTDPATIKAAQAVSSGIIRTNTAPNLALVKDVQPSITTATPKVDETLGDLGFASRLIENRGLSYASYTFTVLPGFTLGSDATFNLIYGHSTLLDYTRSGINIYLNTKPIGSVRMSDVTAANATNQIKITLPPAAVVAGTNTLELRVSLVPVDDCNSPTLHNLWVNIWPESMLHLPVVAATTSQVTNASLATYPAPYTYSPMLDNTAIVLPHDDLQSWRSAVQIANYLGSVANGQLSALVAFYGDSIPAAERSKYNMLIIGQPKQNPIVDEINGMLPIPFATSSNVPQEKNFQVTYIIPADSPMGYLEVLISPWNPDRVVFAALGNTEQGLNYASTALTDATLRAKLAGNFAEVQDQQVTSVDTRQTIGLPPEITQNQGVTTTKIDVSNYLNTEASQQRPAWIPIALGALVLVILVILVSGSFLQMARNRRRKTK